MLDSPPATRGDGEVQGEEGNVLGLVRVAGKLNADDHKVAAPSGTASPAVITVVSTPAATSTRFSQLRAPNDVWFSPLCAKFKIL